jgi:hypothetical protein
MLPAVDVMGHGYRDIKVAVLVFDSERTPKECIVIFCERVVVVS